MNKKLIALNKENHKSNPIDGFFGKNIVELANKFKATRIDEELPTTEEITNALKLLQTEISKRNLLFQGTNPEKLTYKHPRFTVYSSDTDENIITKEHIYELKKTNFISLCFLANFGIKEIHIVPDGITRNDTALHSLFTRLGVSPASLNTEFHKDFSGITIPVSMFYERPFDDIVINIFTDLVQLDMQNEINNINHIDPENAQDMELRVNLDQLPAMH